MEGSNESVVEKQMFVRKILSKNLVELQEVEWDSPIAMGLDSHSKDQRD